MNKLRYDIVINYLETGEGQNTTPYPWTKNIAALCEALFSERRPAEKWVQCTFWKSRQSGWARQSEYAYFSSRTCRKRNNVTYQPSWDRNKKAGDNWLSGIMRRNPQITLRIPEATSIGRKCQIDATRIYNVDETGIQTSTNKPPKVLSVKGKKQVGVISSTEREQTTTVMCCCYASGSFVPPLMIFARKRMQDRLLDGSRGSCSASGWINIFGLV
ncbi:hypothetical protein K1T71_012923 [Dendrolimus kikuchii]|uniref:Uncharacterized protein n=1 Tax=Dendrolimus kikuchii TaxID=765133 RepID=A0ACC1CIL1_9NEOP|nr:hypothetical protein K1T71_012923 [Dendrolimus kikuchii]